jgi:hypothetical protein
MKRELAILLCVLFLTASAAADQKAIKLSGGLSSFFGGDYNRATQGFFELGRDVFGSAQGEFGRIGWGLDFSAEFLIAIRPSICFGIGLGLTRAETPESRALFTDPDDPLRSNDHMVWGVVQAVPLTANIHWTLPVRSGLNLDVFGGPGLYYAQFKFRDDEYDIRGVETFRGQNAYSSSQIVLGIQGGVALEATIWKPVSLLAEIVGRVGSMSGFRGDVKNTYTYTDGTNYSGTDENCTLWISSIAGPTARHTTFVLDQQEPHEPYSGGSLARISLSAVTARVGLKIGL